jgi:long-chain acyl-CoA synthetase
MTTTGMSDFLLSTGEPTDIAVVDGARRYTYADLRAAAAAIAAALEQRGTPSGGRIGLLGPNSFFWIAAYLAAMKVGTAVPLSDNTLPGDLAAQVDWVGCSTVLVDRRSLRRHGEALREVETVTDAVLSGPLDAGWASAVSEPDSDAVLMFTSGTTARPKAVRVTHPNLRANTASILAYLGLDKTDRTLVLLPFHYCFGASLLHTQLAVGGSVVLCNTLTFPQTAVDLLDREDCTVLAGVPSTFRLLLRASSYPTRPLPSLRLVQQAGGRMSPRSVQELAAAQPDSRLFVMYGQTEATARLSYLPPDRLTDKSGSIGRGIPGVELTVVDEADRPVPPGDQGEIVARGASISPGYYRDPEETARKFRGGVLRTGDLATVDADGFIYIVGRSEGFIKSWGHRISPQQIEEAASGHPVVAEAAAVGLPDPEAGERVVLAVVPQPGVVVDTQELLGYLRNQLPKHVVPATVVTLEAFPLNASGKIALPQLRVLLQGSEGGIVDRHESGGT